jgi:hypothetical protein
MLADSTQYTAQVDEFRTIEVQCCYSRPACSDAAYDDQEILAPGKVP